MSEEQLWELIESTRPTENYTLLEHVENLTAVVSGMTREEIINFAEVFETLSTKNRSYQLFLAFNLMFKGQCTDDLLCDAMSSLIFRGRRDFEAVVKSGDRLADFDDFEVCEEACLFIDLLWEELFPEETLIPVTWSGPFIPDWPTSKEDETMFQKRLPLIFPRLYAKYGEPAPPLR